MTIETVLLTVGGDTDRRIDEMAQTTIQEISGTDAEVVLLHVFDRDEFRSLADRMNFPVWTEPSRLAERNTTIMQIKERLEAAGISVTVAGALGDRTDAILETAEDVEADRIIVGGRKRSPVGKALFGSTAQQVMLNASCPTTFVRA